MMSLQNKFFHLIVVMNCQLFVPMVCWYVTSENTGCRTCEQKIFSFIIQNLLQRLQMLEELYDRVT
jgi:hypothetical protein